MEMKLGVCLLLVCEIPGGEMLIVEGGKKGRLRLSQTRPLQSDAQEAGILTLLGSPQPACKVESLSFVCSVSS